MEVWWPKVTAQTRDWLVANNGDVLPPPVVEDIVRAGGAVTSDAWWVGQHGPSGVYLSDAAVDWVEAVANGEAPEAP
jgi:hypothetical protein